MTIHDEVQNVVRRLHQKMQSKDCDSLEESAIRVQLSKLDNAVSRYAESFRDADKHSNREWAVKQELTAARAMLA